MPERPKVKCRQFCAAVVLNRWSLSMDSCASEPGESIVALLRPQAQNAQPSSESEKAQRCETPEYGSRIP